MSHTNPGANPSANPGTSSDTHPDAHSETYTEAHSDAHSGGHKNIVVGVGGGIAAYKACMVIREFTKAGHTVTAIPTPAAAQFIGTATLEALTGQPVTSSVFTDIPQVRHVTVGSQADLVVVVPTTADFLSRIAAGAASDMLTTTLLMATCPILLAPAMHTQMWENSLVQRNVDTLREHGYTVMEPAVGRLTGPDSGAGRLPEPADIVDMAYSLLEEQKLAEEYSQRSQHSPAEGHGQAKERSQVGERSWAAARADLMPRELMPRDLVGRHIIITAGGTREAIDPVRYIGNRSSGQQGAALAACAAQRGAHVTLLLGAHDLPYLPAGVQVETVTSALDLQDKLTTLVETEPVDAVIMAAAVADFRPTDTATTKLKKGTDSEPDSIALTRNPDILASLTRSHPNLVTVGFAAETGDATHTVLQLGREKFARKGCDLLMVNEVGFHTTFGQPTNAGWLLGRGGTEKGTENSAGKSTDSVTVKEIPRMSKRGVAMRILDQLATLF